MNLSDQAVLAEVAKNDPNANIRRKAVKKLKDQAALGEVAQNDKKTDIRILALRRLTDQAAIGEVAKNDKKTDLRRMAIKKLTDPAALGEAAKNDPSADNRRFALKILKKITDRAAKARNVPLLTDGRSGESTEKNEKNEKNEIDRIFEKIGSYVREVDMIGRSIDDRIVSEEAYAILNITAKITAFLGEERQKSDIGPRIRRFEQFADYYFPALIKILGSYRQITQYGLEGGNALETKKRIASSMPLIKSAFEKELDSTYENKMIDVTTDIDVLETVLAGEGIFDLP